MNERHKAVRQQGTMSKPERSYDLFIANVVSLLEEARRQAACSVNAVLTATYWEIGHRIVEFEQGGEKRAGYGKRLRQRLSWDLTERFGRGFSPVNLSQMKKFYLLWPESKIFQTLSEKFTVTDTGTKFQTPSGESSLRITPEVSLYDIAQHFPLPWSAYVRLLSVKNEHARVFYETEVLRGGWSVRQLERQLNSQFYERTALPDEKLLAEELKRTRLRLALRRGRENMEVGV